MGLPSYDARLSTTPYLKNASYWRGAGAAWSAANAAAASSAPCPGAFATQLSGENYVPLALCLHRQLLQHKSRCPLLVVVDDVTAGRNLSQASFSSLRIAVGASQVVPLSSLVARAFAEPEAAWPPPSQFSGIGGIVGGGGGGGKSSSSNSSSLGCATINSNQHQCGSLASSQRKNRFLGAANKYWLWALDAARYPRVAYLDLDVLLLRNVDALLHLDFAQPLAAVTSGPLCNARSFNSGVLVLKPSLITLAWLLLGERFANWPWKGRVPRFQEARLSSAGPVAVVVTRTGSTARGSARARNIKGRSSGSTGGSGGSGIMQRNLSWVEQCAPAHCERYGAHRTCLRGGSSGNATAGANANNLTSSGGGDGGESGGESAGLETCKKRHGGSYSWSRRLKKVCEPSPRDQSVLNWHFNDSSRWLALPRAFNVQPRLWSAAQKAGVLEPGAAGEVAVLHFVGAEKPWTQSARMAAAHGHHAAAAGRVLGKAAAIERLPEPLVNLWRGACES